MTVAAGAGLEATGLWVSIVVGVFTAFGIAATLIISVRNSAKRQDDERYQEGYKDGQRDLAPELWAYRMKFGAIQIPQLQPQIPGDDQI